MSETGKSFGVGPVALDQFTDALIELLPEHTEIEQRIGVALQRRLANGAPVEVGSVAGDVGLPGQQVADALDRMLGVFRDDDGLVVGYFGLTIREMGEHRVRVDGRTVWAWCAWDTLLIPRMLDQTVEVTSRSPIDGAPISLTATPDGPRNVSPQEAVVSFVPIKSDFVKNTIQSFCHYVHFFPSAEAAEPWIEEHPGAFTLPIEDAYRLGGILTQAAFGDVIPPRPVTGDEAGHSGGPLVEILYFEGCPNHQTAIALVERVGRELGIEPELRLVNVPDQRAAQRLRFLGSPTIRVGGVDVDPLTAERDDYALSCRIFRTEAGVSGQPDEQWVREALLREAGVSG
jgi:alkylmercury lyase